MANVIDDLNFRGLIKEYSNEENVRKLFDTKQTIYCGFDPSASSLHIGNFVMISILMRLQRAGHRIIALVGGATGMIGDPSGKSKERNLLTKEGVKANTLAIKNQLERFIDLSDPEKGIIVNNYDWISDISLLDYLRDTAKFFPINYMLNKDIVKSRLETGISLTEFCYMTLQSYDFKYLHDKYGCNLQIGGNDQWGNLTAGLDFIKKTEGDKTDVECMTAHLITRSDGKKFGKSEDGALFLDPNLTSPYKLYQFFYNQSDEDSIKYIKVFTFLSKEEILEIEKEHLANLGRRVAQRVLAYEVTKIIHGKEEADEAVHMSEVLFSNDFKSLKEKQIEEIFGNYKIELSEELPLEDLLIRIKASSSKREAREFIKNGAVSINGEKQTDNMKILTRTDALYNKYLIVRRGKKNYYLVSFN
ncbi:MAG: tyrosine--tRNA ligase [Candidatus Onthovivens sp.]|nr:tyrosine--tRNA ligase [Candidatus Onthovivens sp.]